MADQVPRGYRCMDCFILTGNSRSLDILK